ncbi:unnamed protein product [Wickerhamomyces anomalus]
MSQPYDRYVKVVEAEFPRMTINSTIPTGISLAVVFDHYRIRREWKSQNRKPVNLFFMSGTGMTKAIWQYHIKRLFQYSEEHEDLPWQLNNVIAVDLVNHGESAVENTGRLGFVVDWREGAHDLIQVAKSLRLQGTNVVVGHSMGGFQALYASTLAPLMFQHAVVIEPVIYGDPESSARLDRMIPSLNKVIKSRFKNEQEFDHFFKKQSIFKSFNSEILDDFIESEKLVHRDGTVSAKTSKEQQLICYMNASSAVRLWREILSNVTIPVIHVIGSAATWNPPQSVKEVRQLLKHVKGVDIEGGLHLVNCEKPDTIVDILLNCLNNNIDKTVEIDPYQGKSYEDVFNENFHRIYSAKL